MYNIILLFKVIIDVHIQLCSLEEQESGLYWVSLYIFIKTVTSLYIPIIEI